MHIGDSAVSFEQLIPASLEESTIGDLADLAVPAILNYIGEKALNSSSKPKAYFQFYTRCVNRGNMYGEPVYAYEVYDVKRTY